MTRLLLIACVLAPLVLLSSRAAADSEVDTLREQLRSTVLQLRQLQDQQAAAVAAPPAAPDADTAALKAKLAAAQAELRTARRAASAAAGLQAALSKAQGDNAALTTAAAAQAAELGKFKLAYNQAAEAARGLSGERDHLKAQLAQTQRIAATCQAKNTRLIAFSEDLLAAYRKIGFGQVLAAREPILGLRRVQLENLAQDREDTVRADRCDAQLDAAPPAKPAAPGG